MKKFLFVLTILLSLTVASGSAFAVTIDAPTDGASLTGKPVTFQGTSSPNADVSLLEDDVEIATTTANDDGEWTITTSALSAGEHEYTARETRQSVWAFMNPSQDGRVDIVDMTTKDFETSFEIPEPYFVNDLQVSGDYLFVLGTDSENNNCEIFSYYTPTLEEVPLETPLLVPGDCYGINLDISEPTQSMSVLYWDGFAAVNEVAVFDLEDGEYFDTLTLDFDFGSPINTLISEVQDALYINYETGIEKYVVSGPEFVLDDQASHAFTARTSAVFTDGEGYIVYGDNEGNIVERYATNIANYTQHPVEAGATFNVAAVSPNNAFFYVAGMGEGGYKVWEWSTGSNQVTNEINFDQYPESIGVTPNSQTWVIGDNHAFGYIYIGDVNSDAIDVTLQRDGSSYRMSSDDFFSASIERTYEATITTTNTFGSPANAGFTDGSQTKTVAPGDKISLSGSGYQSGSEITITLNSTPVLLATLQASGSGTFSTQVTIPKNTALGAHTLVIAGTDANGNPVNTVLNVNVAYLAATGSSSTSHIVTALTLIAVGFVLSLSRRRVLSRVFS